MAVDYQKTESVCRELTEIANKMFRLVKLYNEARIQIFEGELALSDEQRQQLISQYGTLKEQAKSKFQELP